MASLSLMTCIVVGPECLCSLFNANAFFLHFLLVAAASAPARYGRRSQSNTKQARKALYILLVKPKLIENESANEQENGKVGSRTRWSKERGGPYSGTEPYDARVSRTVPLRRV